MDFPAEWFNFNDDYVEKLRTRDPVTVRHFVGYFSPMLRIKLRSRFDRKEDIEDVSQDVFCRVLKAIDQKKIQDGRKLAAYVVGVTHLAGLEAIKKIGRNKTRNPEAAERPNPAPSPERELMEKERNERVCRVLFTLSEKDRRVLSRLMFHGQDRKLFAKEFGYSPEQVRVLLHRAIQRFGAKYKASGAGE